MGKLRRATLTVGGVACANVGNVNYNTANKHDRRRADDNAKCLDPVRQTEEGTFDFELISGTLPACYNQDIVLVGKDVTVVAGVETVTTRTVTLTNCTINNGMSFDNDAGQGSRKITGEFSGCSET